MSVCYPGKLSAQGVGGEDCASAAVIGAIPFVGSGETCGALDDYNESCPFNPTGGRDVVYRYTPDRDLSVTIDLCSSGFDTKVYLYEGSCPSVSNSGVYAGCNDDACGVNGWRSQLVDVDLLAGVDYFLVVDGYGAADCGSYDLSIVERVPSDLCELAEEISIPWSGTVSTSGAVDDYNESCPFDVAGAPDVVRRFIATETGEIRIDLCESNFDTKVYVYEGVCPAAGSQNGSTGSGTAIGCNDDACGENGFRSRLSFMVTEGLEYFVVFDGYGINDSGEAVGTIMNVPPAGPGEECEQAFVIPALPFQADGFTAGVSRFEHQCQFVFAGAPEHFYRYTATHDTWIEIDSCGSDFDTEIALFSGPCPPVSGEPTNANVRACNDDGCGVDATRARIPAAFVAAGETVSIVIDGNSSGDFGAYSLHVKEVCAPDHPSELASPIEVGTGPIGLAMHAGLGRLFVTNYVENSLSVIDTATDEVEATIPVSPGPYRLALTPDGTRLYIVNYSANRIDCFDPLTLDLIDSFSAQGVNPLGLAITPDGESLFVATAGDGRVTRWSIPGHQVLGEVGGLGAPREMISSPEGDLVYVSDPTGVKVWEITVNTLVATAIAVDEFPQALALTENGEHLLVGNFGFDRSLDHASVIHRHSREVVARLRIGTGPEEMVLVPNTPYLAVTNWGFSRHPNTGPGELGAGLGNVAIVRLPDFNLIGNPNSPPMIDAIERVIPVGGDYTFGIAASPAGDKIYAANLGYDVQSGNTVSVVQFPDGWVRGRFVRGDANADSLINVADPITLLDFLFAGGPLHCANAGDVNDDEVLDIADPIALLTHLFSGGSAPPAPGACGVDPTAGDLCCDESCEP